MPSKKALLWPVNVLNQYPLFCSCIYITNAGCIIMYQCVKEALIADLYLSDVSVLWRVRIVKAGAQPRKNVCMDVRKAKRER